MIIKHMTASFGTLENAELDLKSGLNIVEGKNESGKSTWCAFVRTMLYGINTAEKDKAGFMADKNKFRPWSGKPMQGSMEIEYRGKDITLQRTSTGKLGPMKSFSAVYTETATPVQGLTGEDAGEKLIGVPLRVFERSAFITQAGISVGPSPELEKRVAALVSTGEEDISYSEADERLRKWLRERKFNKRGLLPQLDGELERRKSELERSSQVNVRYAALKGEIERLEDMKEEFLGQQELYDRKEKADGRALLEEAREKTESIEAEMEKYWETVGDIPREQADSASALEAKLIASREMLEAAKGKSLEESAKCEQLAEAIGESKFAGKSAQEAVEEAEALRDKAYIQKKKFVLHMAVAGVLLLAAIALLITALAAGKTRLYPFAGAALALCGAAIATARKPARSEGGSPEELLREAREYEKQTEDLREAEDELADARLSLARAEESLKDATEELIRKAKAYDAGVSDTDAALAALEKARKAYDALDILEPQRLAAKKFYNALAIKDYGKAVERPEQVPKPKYSKAEVASGLKYAEKELSNLKTAFGAAENELKTIGDPLVIESEMSRLQTEREALNEEYEALTMAIDVLSEANDEIQAQFAPLLSKTAADTMYTLTGGKYTELVFDRDFSAQAGEGGAAPRREAIQLSAGTADQLYLALRLAICEHVLPSDEPCPIVLDEALVSFDDIRMGAALNLLRKLAEKRQIILFTCQSREAEYFKNDVAVNIVKL
ncbi:MAG: AAA family ATPase [Oscillospiraceae bacterium]|nr:AAA family ATPase [Oscillospiraceae bacterium]